MSLTKTTTAVGRKAETAVVFRLEQMGHEILARNYRTRYYEIDIISRRGGRIFFTEVKYRKDAAFGDGFCYITPKKLQQMRFAAEVFMSDRQMGCLATLAAASVTGEDFRVEVWMEIEE